MEQIISQLMILIAVGFIYSFFVIGKQVVGMWLNPISIFSLLWVVYILVPLIGGLGSPINPMGTYYIVVFILFFSIPIFCFNWKIAMINNRNKFSAERAFGSNNYIFIFGIFFVAAITCHILDFVSQGIDLSAGILNAAGAYAARRYENELNQNAYSKIALLASFQCTVFGGLIFGALKKMKLRAVVSAMSFIPSLFIMIFQSAKGLFFLSAAYFLGAWMVTRIFDQNFVAPQVKVSRLGGPLILVLGFVTISFLSRTGGSLDEIDATLDALKHYFVSYSSGHLFAFSDWFSDRYLSPSIAVAYFQPELTAGFYSFMSFFRLLGDDQIVPLGIYSEVYEIDGIMTTNIYTVFRGLISDFGIIGSLVFALMSGFVVSHMFYRLLNANFSTNAVAFFIYFIGIAYQSYIVSSLTWVSIPLSCLITILALFFLKFPNLCFRPHKVIEK
jgi:oligosaccharide repeat unit polymerase